MVAELDRILALPHGVDGSKCMFVACSDCGHPHIAADWPPSASLCLACTILRETDDDDRYVDYGGGH